MRYPALPHFLQYVTGVDRFSIPWQFYGLDGSDSTSIVSLAGFDSI
jgi:hypothetical protein